MKRNGSQILLDILEDSGVDTIFGYPGGAVIPLYDELYNRMDKFNHIRSAHEQGAVHAADGYARSTGKIGVCFVTSGPGATNAMTGIATAYMDSTPLLVISGQVPSVLLGKDSFQEIDITGMSMPITKHNSIVYSGDELEKEVRKAIEIATSGRPGPVLIDVPKDIFIKVIETSLTFEYSLKEQKLETNESQIEELADLIKNAKRPLIHAGGGVKLGKAQDELLDLAEKCDIPVVNTLMSLGIIPREHRLSLGMAGMHGSVSTNMAVMNADLVIAIGSRFSDRVIGDPDKFAKKANIVHIDIDQTEFNKNVETHLKICGRLDNILDRTLSKVDAVKNDSWIDEINGYAKETSFINKTFNPKTILNSVNDKFSGGFVVTDVGQHQMWTAQKWNFTHSKEFITSGGLGTMGFGLGAAIGAKVGNPDKPVVLITGDGSFRMNSNELVVASEYNIPVVIVVLNNSALGMVRQWQKLFQTERYSETCIGNGVDFCKLADAYSIENHFASNIEDLKTILDNLGDVDRPILIECTIDKDEDVYPIVPPGKSIDNYLI